MVKEIINYRILAHKVLAVVVIRVVETEDKIYKFTLEDGKNYNIEEWTVYVDAVPGISHEDEYEAVAFTGQRQNKAVAASLFSDYNIDKYKW